MKTLLALSIAAILFMPLANSEIYRLNTEDDLIFDYNNEDIVRGANGYDEYLFYAEEGMRLIFNISCNGSASITIFNTTQAFYVRHINGSWNQSIEMKENALYRFRVLADTNLVYSIHLSLKEQDVLTGMKDVAYVCGFCVFSVIIVFVVIAAFARKRKRPPAGEPAYSYLRQNKGDDDLPYEVR